MAKYDRHRFSGLELLPTPLLEKIIEQDLNQEADYDPELIDYVLELMVQRAKNQDPHHIPPMQSSWNKLQQRLDGEVDLGPLPPAPAPVAKPRKPSRIRPILRYAAVAAACIAIIFGAMITAQAMGVDMFGTLAQWTDSTFRFEASQYEPTDVVLNTDHTENLLRNALADRDMPVDLAPSWIPQDYKLVEIDSFATKLHKGVRGTYLCPHGENNLAIEICEYIDLAALNNNLYEKVAETPEVYLTSGNKFYLFENSGTWTATWSNRRYGITIAGAYSKETIISIINSIQEVTNG